MTVALSSAMWAECRTIARLEETELHRFRAVTLRPAQLARLEREICATRHLLHSSSTPQAAAFSAREAANLVMHLALTTCELAARKTSPRDSLRNRTRLARRAEAWMREHLAECIRISDVCAALRVSRRELEYAFRSTYDQSPRDFLHILRLHAIRQALLCSLKDQTILEIAFAHGITHPSRFAADYRALFGIRPSEEAKRRGEEAA
jgi:AraC family ethanolamine operon transcriptional activator